MVPRDPALVFESVEVAERRGVGVVWEGYEKAGVNPTTGETTTVRRRRLATVMELPMREAYEGFVARFIHPAA